MCLLVLSPGHFLPPLLTIERFIVDASTICRARSYHFVAKWFSKKLRREQWGYIEIHMVRYDMESKKKSGSVVVNIHY